MNQKRHLTPEQRYVIEMGQRIGNSKRKTALMIGVHPSTVSREIARNGSLKGIYLSEKAQLLSVKRAKTSHVSTRIDAKTWSGIEACILEGHSPEQISCRLEKALGVTVSHERIYTYISRDAKLGGTLYKHLRQSHRKRKLRVPKKPDRRGQIKNRIGIEERPIEVEMRNRIGDWEVDTIIGRGSKASLVTAVERCSLATKIFRVPNREAPLVSAALIGGLYPFKKRVYTITADNGKEFAGHGDIAHDLKADFFFARPYCSWERGSNENTNGLIRQYVPKRTVLSKVTKADISEIEWKINNRPRKSLGYRTAAEIFLEITGLDISQNEPKGKTSEELYHKCNFALAT